MGANSSKPDTSHVWKAPGPVGISQDIVESLQSSSETDSSRAQTIELAIQARVAEELKKLSAQESSLLAQSREKASEVSTQDDKDALARDRHVVSKEVETLRQRLDKRKQLKPLPETIEQARGSVVKCLMENDRRPLDCWKEVEAFKEEVRKMEKSWVDKTLK